MTRRDWIAEELTSGALARITPVVDDPGNPGQVMALCRHRFGGRFLVAANGTPEPDGTHRLISVHVPEHLRDPLSAAAWTYDDESHPVRCTPTFYAHLARRT